MTPDVSTSSDLVRMCRRCSRAIPPNALACEFCHTLVYSDRLDEIAAGAKVLEQQGHLDQARERWLSALVLLPASSTQAQWIQDHARSLATADSANALSATFAPEATVSRDRNTGSSALLRLAAVLSFLAFAAIYSRGTGARLGIGFAVLILIHEMGHYIDIRRRGLPADMPIFLPGIGAYVRWRAMGVSLRTRAAVSLAGPFAGFLSAVACAILWWQTRDPYWATLARVAAALNLLNLIPIWVLDGGHASLALGRRERIGLLVASLLLWSILRDPFLLAFAAGAAYRCFVKRDLPSKPSLAINIYFLALLTALAVLLHFLPGKGFGIR